MENFLLVGLGFAVMFLVYIIAVQHARLKYFRAIQRPCERCGRNWPTLIWDKQHAAALCHDCLADMNRLKDEDGRWIHYGSKEHPLTPNGLDDIV